MKPLAADARILIIKTHAIGDLLMSTAAIRDLREAYPSAHIALLTGRWSADAVRRNPHLDEILEFEDRKLLDAPRHPFAVAGLLARIRRKRFDAALVFHPLPALHLFARLAGIPVRYGLAREGRSSRFLTASVREDLGPDAYYPVNFQRVAALAGAIPGSPEPEAHFDVEDARDAGALLRAGGIGPETPYILAAPGGGRNSKEDVAAKRWPAESFAEAVREAVRRHPELRVVLTGAPSDREENRVVAAGIPGALDLTGRTRLRQLFALAKGARAVLCNDSALLHIAVASGAPVVVPFGPTLRERFVPPALRHLSIQAPTRCSPCYVGGAFPGCAIGHRCMREIAPADALARLEAILAGPAPAGRG